MAMTERHVMISQEELKNIRELYEGVMSSASHGLFFKEGSIIGIGVASIANRDKATYFETCRRVLREKNWVKEVRFEADTVVVSGSIEASRGDSPTCHRLRGIIRKIYEVYMDKKIYCQEIECESTGRDRCTFKIISETKW
jgi:predicted hydrocarbon binding protein